MKKFLLLLLLPFFISCTSIAPPIPPVARGDQPTQQEAIELIKNWMTQNSKNPNDFKKSDILNLQPIETTKWTGSHGQGRVDVWLTCIELDSKKSYNKNVGSGISGFMYRNLGNELVMYRVEKPFWKCSEMVEAYKQRRRNEEITEMQEEALALLKLKEKAKFLCNGKIECEKIFALTQIFISQNSDMKIQFSNDTIIETFNPTNPTEVGVKAFKTPGKNDSYEISLTAFCKDNGDRSSNIICNKKLTNIYESYKSYIKSTMMK